MVYRKFKMNTPSPMFITDNLHNQHFRNKVKKAMFAYYKVEDKKLYSILCGKQLVPDFIIKPSMVFTADGFTVIFEKFHIGVVNLEVIVTEGNTEVSIDFDKINEQNETVNRFSNVDFSVFTYDMFISLFQRIVIAFDSDTTKDEVSTTFDKLKSENVKLPIINTFVNVFLFLISEEYDALLSIDNSEKETSAQYIKYIWTKNDTEKFFSELYDLIINHLYKEILS